MAATTSADAALCDFADMLDALAEGSGPKDRIATLKEYLEPPSADTEPLRMLTRYALDPFINFGIANFEVPAGIAGVVANFSIDHVQAMLDILAQRKIKGTEARDKLAAFMAMLNGEPATGGETSPREAFARIIRKDLRCGVSAGGGTIEKACPGLIQSFDCQLAASEMPHVSELSYPVVVEPKYDGVRCLCVIDAAGVPTLWSRNGKPFENFEEIERDVIRRGLKNVVLDGEVLGLDHANQYKAVMSRAKASRGKHTDVPIVYQVFDLINREAFAAKDEPLQWATRRGNLSLLLATDPSEVVKLAPTRIAHSQIELQAYYDEVVAKGFEGVIIKDLQAPYHFKRSKAWRKLKPMDTADLSITAVLEGEGKYSGMAGAIMLAGEHAGKQIVTKCGSGWSDAQRVDFWQRRSALVGAVAEVKYQEISLADGSDTYSLRFPIFLRLRAGAGEAKL